MSTWELDSTETTALDAHKQTTYNTLLYYLLLLLLLVTPLSLISDRHIMPALKLYE